MNNFKFLDEDCALSQALGLVGSRWAMLIVRDAAMGLSRFNDFQSKLGIGRNILARRLAELVEAGVLDKTQDSEDKRVFFYTLTPKGRALAPALFALSQWADEWVYGEDKKPVVYCTDAGPIPRVEVLDASGEPVQWGEVVARPGPGASEELRAALGDGVSCYPSE